MLALPILAAAAVLAAPCRAVDGDTLRCGRERVRLTGIDAPEMPGHCARWRRCAPGDPFASKAALSALVRGQQIRLVRFGKDSYGRTLAIAYAGPVNLACAQIGARRAIYVARWDTGHRIRTECP